LVYRYAFNAVRYILLIKSFANSSTRRLFEGDCPRRFGPIRRVAERKLAMLDAAVTLDFLRSPPGNRLEKLRGDRRGQYSIRINSRWRVCFEWRGGDAHEVEIVDYHRG
jgi:proteic killer suppression protein